MADSFLNSLKDMPSWNEYKDFALQTQASNNAWSAEQAQKQMDFQERLANNAHLREVRDLKAAGLNPVLSTGGSGASAPAGASGQTDTSVLQSITSYLMQQNQNLVNLEQQRVSAETAMATAKMQSDATRAAAAAAAAASRYAADKNYALQIELASKYPNTPWGTLSAVLNGDNYDGQGLIRTFKGLINKLGGNVPPSARSSYTANSNVSKVTGFLNKVNTVNTYIKQLRNGGSITSHGMFNAIMDYMRNSPQYFNGSFSFYRKSWSSMDFLERAVYSYMKSNQSGGGRR